MAVKTRTMKQKEAITKAQETSHKTVIACNQDTGAYELFEISSLAINDLEAECYRVAYENNGIAVAVCSGTYQYGGRTFPGEINYTDL